VVRGGVPGARAEGEHEREITASSSSPAPVSRPNGQHAQGKFRPRLPRSQVAPGARPSVPVELPGALELSVRVGEALQQFEDGCTTLLARTAHHPMPQLGHTRRIGAGCTFVLGRRRSCPITPPPRSFAQVARAPRTPFHQRSMHR
jgi:hypothetical protein